MTNLTNKQEKFAQKYIETGNASESYRQSYSAEKMKPETITVKASELLKNGKVAVRVEELQAAHRKRHEITVDSLTKELEEARTLALKEGQSSAMVSATMGKAKLHGLIKDKHELAGKDGKPLETTAETREDIRAQLMTIFKEHGRKPGHNSTANH